MGNWSRSTSKAPNRMPGGTSVGGFQPSSSGLVQSRNRRSASSRTSPTISSTRAIPSVQSLISLSQVWLYCSWVVALVCSIRLVELAPILLVLFLERGDPGRIVFLDLLDALVAAPADLLELGRVGRVGLLGLLLLALLEFGDAASHRLLGLAHRVVSRFLSSSRSLLSNSFLTQSLFCSTSCSASAMRLAQRDGVPRHAGASHRDQADVEPRSRRRRRRPRRRSRPVIQPMPVPRPRPAITAAARIRNGQTNTSIRRNLGSLRASSAINSSSMRVHDRAEAPERIVVSAGCVGGFGSPRPSSGDASADPASRRRRAVGGRRRLGGESRDGFRQVRRELAAALEHEVGGLLLDVELVERGVQLASAARRHLTPSSASPRKTPALASRFLPWPSWPGAGPS